MRGAVRAVARAEEVHAGREERARALRRRVAGRVREEAVPEEGALEDGVDERVEEVPDEEDARFSAAVGW